MTKEFFSWSTELTFGAGKHHNPFSKPYILYFLSGYMLFKGLTFIV